MNIAEMTIEQVWKNRELIMTQKKNAIKHSDSVNLVISTSDNAQKENATKQEVDTTIENPTVLNAKLVINTTNLIDSHMDCHIKGIWKKSLSETKTLYLLQEHEMEFDKIIADSVQDNLQAYTKNVTFKSLGYDYEGSTEALVFDTKIKQEINPFMFDLYKKGRVYNHSVGMRYVKLYLCINSNEAEYSAEKDNWDKYYPLVANKEVANEKGFFWAVTEAKVIEGSAVIKGSNHCTPVMEIEIEKEADDHHFTDNDKPNEPSADTQMGNKQFFINLLN